MSSADPQISVCRNCQYYQLQGRRGGMCQKLNVVVEADWSACSLALPVFTNSIEALTIDRSTAVVRE